MINFHKTIDASIYSMQAALVQNRPKIKKT